MKPLLSLALMPVCVSVILLTVVCDSLAQTEDTVEVPFKFVHDEIIVRAMIHGKGPFNVMIDTGTDPSAIDLKTAREIGLKIASTGGKGEGGGTGVNLAYETELPVVEIGSLRATDVRAVAIDLSAVSQRMGITLNGVLGHSLLNKRIVQFDYPGKVVRFFSKSSFEKPSGLNTAALTVVPFHYDDNVLIDATVNGRKVTANFDTGSNGGFQITPAAAAELGLESEAAKGRALTGIGYNGAGQAREGKVQNVTIGAVSFDSPAVTFFGKGTGHDNKPWGLNIGNLFLKDFVVTLDYPAKTIRFERSRSAK